MSETTIRQRRAPPARTPAAGWRSRTPTGVLAAVAVGGALGAPARYGLGQLAPGAPGRFPWATLGVNVSGSLALGVVLVLVLERFGPTRYLRPLVATGFLGAYTTYSTFAVETVMLIHDGHLATALAYTVASLVGGLVAVWAGMAAGRHLPLPRPARTMETRHHPGGRS